MSQDSLDHKYAMANLQVTARMGDDFLETVAFRLWTGYEYFQRMNFGLIAEPITFRRVKEMEMRTEPTFVLAREEAQQLMNQLWECGFRPVQGKGSAGQLEAIRYHLEDMRKLVFQGESDD
jgi:hypothetical protein